MKETLTKSRARVKALGEVFTPTSLVDEMLDKLPSECWEEGKTFLEPSCGTGNFLVRILERKLKMGHDPLQALGTLYGIDIMEDNIRQTKERLLLLVPGGEEVLEKNIKCADALKINIKEIFTT